MAISYFDVWKKRMENNGDIVQSRLNNSKNIFNNSFKDDASYRLAKLKSKEVIDEIDLDIRLANDENNPLKKKILVRPDTIIEVGDYITYKERSKTKTCLVLSVEENLISPLSNTQECNHLAKWMYKGNLYKTLSIVTNATKYTEGTKAVDKSIIEIEARYSIIVPDTKKTRTIEMGTRFIINDVAWQVTQIDYTTNIGIVNLTLGKSSVNPETDDLDLGIADYKTVKHDYKFDIPSNFNVTKDDSVKLSYSIQDNLKDIDYDLVSVEYTSSLIQITKDSKDITIIGKELGTGSIKLKVNLNNEVKEFNITFNVVQTSVNEVKYEVKSSNNYTYRIKEGSTISAIKYINGVADDTLQIDYILSQLGQDLLSKGNISIVKKTNNSLQIRNEKINTNMTFTLTIINKTTGDKILDNQVITLKGV
ncbi:MAG: hypothetical protein Q8936_19470 [Bacillota bacterium]|nr:hypothetical protein [Bacillota bacterium]